MSKNQNTIIPDDMNEYLERYAQEDDVSVSHIVRRAIKKYIEERENLTKE